MLKQIAWNTFKSTGNIDTLLELLEVDKTLDEVGKKERTDYGTYKNEGTNTNPKQYGRL